MRQKLNTADLEFECKIGETKAMTVSLNGQVLGSVIKCSDDAYRYKDMTKTVSREFHNCIIDITEFSEKQQIKVFLADLYGINSTK